jgi:hypothetical protein
MSKLSRRHRAQVFQGEARPFAGMRQITPHAAGVDIGAHEIVACVHDGEDQQMVRTFGTYTADLLTLADWFVDRGIQTVAMESTGVYWIPLFEELEARGLQCCLRHRAQLLEHRAPHVLHMQQALLQMNIQLSQALSDITGLTGQRIIRAIVAGERDPAPSKNWGGQQRAARELRWGRMTIRKGMHELSRVRACGDSMGNTLKCESDVESV